MNNISVASVTGLVVTIGIILLFRFLIDLLFRKKRSSTPPASPQPEIPAQTPVPRKPLRVAWVKIAFLLLCIVIYAALEYENGASIAAVVANLPSSSPLHFLAGNSVSVISYTELFFWALIVVMSLAVFNNIMLVLFASPQNRNVRGKWTRHVATQGRPLVDEDFGAQTKVVEAFVNDGDKDALLKFFSTHDVVPEWLASYQKNTVSMWILVALATFALSLAFFLWPAHDTYLTGLGSLLGNTTIPNLNAYQSEVVFIAVVLLFAGFSVGTLCWSWIVQPIERLFGRRSRRRLIMEQSKIKPI